MRCLTVLAISVLLTLPGRAAEDLDQRLPVRGLCIAAPRPAQVERFAAFIRNELAPRSVNTLVLRVDFNYQFTNRTELANPRGLSLADARKLAEACKETSIRLIPQVNLLGHQSWAVTTGTLLRVYPEFDETPWVKAPEKYVWPNPDRLYCRSYCPLHPKVHEVVLPVVDEVCDAFGADAFHAGMDEVFYIGEEKCARCGGKDKAQLFAGEVTLLRNHLKKKERVLWIWGDRLLDGKTTGLGEWEASENDTHRATDLIPRDVFICDWHYERPDPTAVFFAMKGFNVVTCPWRNSEAAVRQLQDMVRFREHSVREMRTRFQGVMQTVWSDANTFFKEIESATGANGVTNKTAGACFVRMFGEISNLK